MHNNPSLNLTEINYLGLSFSEPAVRDLAWALISPALMQTQYTSPISQSQIPSITTWLKALDKQPAPLQQHLTDRNPFALGAYFEALWEFYLIHYSDNILLAKNLQVFSDKTTLGEFDFIYQHKPKHTTCHLEVAVKFYLGLPDETANKSNTEFSPMNYWIGPGGKDRLDKKYSKLVDKQCKLSQTEAGKALLQKNSWQVEQQQACLLGYLFYPVDNELPPPINAGKKHNRGFWIRQSQLADWIETDSVWVKLNKPHWLSSQLSTQTKTYSSKQLVELCHKHFKHNTLSLLFEKISLDLDAHLINKQTSLRLFVVSDQWPNLVNKK